MSRKDPSPAPPQLNVEPEVALEGLVKLKERASELMAQQVTATAQALEGFRLQIVQWRDYGADCLRRWFSTDEYAERFTARTRGAMVLGARTEREIFEDRHSQLRDGLAFLEFVQQVVTDVIPTAPPRPPETKEGTDRAARMAVTIHGQVAALNLGDVGGDIRAVANTVMGPGAAEFQKGIAAILDGIETDDGIDGDTKRQATEVISFVAAAASEPPEKRSFAVIQTMMAGLQSLLKLSGPAHQAIIDWSPTVEGFFRHLNP